MPYVKGQSGNPAGRPKGAKGKLVEAFWKDFKEAWEKDGAVALSNVATNDPSTFVRVAASLMPKEMELAVRQVAARDMSDDELASIAAERINPESNQVH